jgi:enamine deaminase RidA (YjgF/YER057c/UK114 family)
MRVFDFLTSSVSLGIMLALAAAQSAHAQDVRRFVEPDVKTGSSAAVVVGNVALAHTGQVLPVDGKGNVVAPGRVEAQIKAVMGGLERSLNAGASSLELAVKINVYAARTEVADAVRGALAKRFSGAAKPAVSYVVGNLAVSEALVAMDAVAVCREESVRSVTRTRVEALPGPEGSAQVAILPAGGKVFIAGQAEQGETPVVAARKTLESLRATMTFLGLDDAHVVQVKSFLTPISAAAEVEREIVSFYGGKTAPPAVFVEWSSTLPIEIELVAYAGDRPLASGGTVEYLTPPGMTTSPVYSRVARTFSPETIYISGLYGMSENNAEAEITGIFDSLARLSDATGSDLKHLAKATYYCATDASSTKLNELRPRYYDPKRPPAASKAMVTGAGLSGRSLTIDMIAVPKKN